MSKSYKPFDSAEEVWFWFCGCMIARGDGLRSKTDYPGEMREIEAADVWRIIKVMKKQNELNNRNLRILAKWGCLGRAPYYDRRAKNSEVKVWDISLRFFENHLRNKRIIP